LFVRSDRVVVTLCNEYGQHEEGKFVFFVRFFAFIFSNTRQHDADRQTENKTELERTLKQRTLDRKDALLTNPVKAAFYEKEINILNKEISKTNDKIVRYETMIAAIKDYVCILFRYLQELCLTITAQPTYEKRKKEVLKTIKKDSEKKSKEEHLDMIENHGSKMANVVVFMKKLLKNPENRAIIFSSVSQTNQLNVLF